VRILLVEDDEDDRFVTERTLRRDRRSHDLVMAFTAEAAMRILEVEPRFDAVLLDIQLGHGALDGWSVAGYMQAIPKHRDVPIIILSGMPPEGIREGARRYTNLLASATVILGKPIKADELVRVIERVTKRG
jgi:CheY-like chemotaxis protein